LVEHGYWITWSARGSSEWGTVMPRVLAVLRFDDQLELRRLLDGQVGGLGAFENLVHVAGGASI